MPEPEDALRVVEAASAELRRATAALDAAVLASREVGATLAQVGAVLGVSRQGAHEKFGSVVAARRRQNAPRDEDPAQMRLDD